MNDVVPPEEPADSNMVQAGYLGVSPPVGQLPGRGERAWVDRPEQLRVAVNALEQSPVVAVDAEFTQVRVRAQNEALTTTQRLALLQLAIDGKCFVVDALRLNDLSPLNSVLENPNITVLLHGAGADLRVMAERGLNVAHYLDLEAASRSIFGQHESSLAAMLQRAFHMRLDKSLQRTDWTRRPLPSAMIAYAARDAEMTLALYYWLDEHFSNVLQLYDSMNLLTPVSAWIEPFLRGSSPVSVDMAVAEAIEKGTIRNMEQVYADMKAALATLNHPMRRSRLLRVIADLSLVDLAPDIEPLLYAPTVEERAAAIRTLGRLGVKESEALIIPLLQDPVQEVRRAAQTALRGASPKEPRSRRATPVRNADGTRSWIIGEKDETGKDASSNDNDWKARLRSIMGE
ncbi:MAG TPA: HEAT repeat domain-containing protein [Ktedonobacteraceae bacterium]|nr:HEAT repeat domain-containing protein [Ktedonobacteraceae bacterium]